MPEIPIGATSGVPFPSVLAGEVIGTLMLWPDQPKMIKKRKTQLFGRAAKEVYSEAIAANQRTGAAELEALRRLARKARSLPTITAENAARLRAGRITGAIIIEALAKHRFTTPDKASLQQAKARWAKEESISLKRIDKFDWWPRFKPVAHLWAAYCLIWRPDGLQGEAPFPCKIARLPDFLAVAGHVLSECGAARAQQASLPILDETKAWRPPSEMWLPAGSVKFVKS
jgi:hypothetical protein